MERIKTVPKEYVSLEEMTDEIAYNSLLDQQPEMLKSIRALLDQGQSPEQIYIFMMDRGYKGLIAEVVRGAAYYMNQLQIT